MLRKHLLGISLIELIVAMAILAVLLALGVPAYRGWMENTQLRAAAESIRGGLITAKSEAMRRNVAVRFSLFDSNCNPSTALVSWTGGSDWIVSLDDPTSQCNAAVDVTNAPRIIQAARAAGERTSVARVVSGQSMITFNGLGRLTPPRNCNILVRISSTTRTCGAGSNNAHCLNIAVSPFGQVRMCDPLVTNTADPRACPPTTDDC